MQPKGYLHATCPTGSVIENLAACSQRATSMPLILLEVSVEVTGKSVYIAKGLPPCNLSCWKCQQKLQSNF